MPYQLGYATKKSLVRAALPPDVRRRLCLAVSLPFRSGYARRSASGPKNLDAATRVELASTRLQDERSETD